MSLIQTTTLYFQDGSSDKVYQINLQQENSNSGYEVICHYGRRGTSLQSAIKTSKPVDFNTAKKVFDKTVAEKRSKGYKDGDDVNGVVNNTNAKNESGLMPQLLNSIDLKDVMRYINDDAYMAQEKFDGVRLMTKKSKGGVIGSNKRGLFTSLATTIHDSLSKIDLESFKLDGEAIGDHYYVFDLLEINDVDRLSTSAANRMGILHHNILNSEYIHIVYTANTTQEKLALYTRIMDEGGEGLVFKLKSSEYIAGRPNSGGTHLKFKFVESASCVVTGIHPSKRSVSLSVFDGFVLTDIGNATIPPNKNIPAENSMVEIRYLYAVRGGSLIQPVYLGERTDITEAECDISQLKYKQELKAA